MNGDRFILNRRKVDLEKANFWLYHPSMKESVDNYYRTTSIMKQDIHYCKKLEYENQLTRAFGIDSVASRILPLSSRSRVYSIEKNDEQWPVRPRSTSVYKPQLAVLDLPNIRNDICSNIIHWSSSNHLIAALGKIIWLWHVPTSTMFKNISCLYDVIALKANANSSSLAFSCKEEYECKLKVWSFETNKTKQINHPLCNHRYCWITCIEYHSSNKYLIIGCKTGNIAVLDTNLLRVSTVRDAHNNQDVIKIKCSFDGRHVASSGYDGHVNIWTFPHLELLYSYYQSFCSRGISWHPWRASYLCVGTTNGNLALLNTALAKCVHSNREPATIIYDITFNKISGELVTSQTFCEPGTVDQIGELVTNQTCGEPVIFDEIGVTFGEPGNPVTYQSQINVLSRFNHVVDRFEGHCRRVLFLEWSPDNRTLASAGSDETIHLWKFFEEKNKTPKNHVTNRDFNFNLENFIR